VRWRLGGSRAGREPEDADTSEPVVLCIASTEAEATMMRGLLAENDIEVAVAPSGGSDLRSLYGAGGRCVLLVLPDNLDEARALIATHFS
jgi:Putative prokaryotic signal transducing protein